MDDHELSSTFARNHQVFGDKPISNRNHAVKRKLEELKSQIKETILNGETCPSWHHKLPPIPLDELKSTVEAYTSEFEELIQFQKVFNENANGLPQSPRHTLVSYDSAVEILSKRCIQIYIYILFKNYEEARPNIASAYELIEECLTEKYFSEDYAVGYRYVVRALEIFCAIEADSEVEFETGREVEESVDFVKEREKDLLKMYRMFLSNLKAIDNFSVKNQVGVLAVQQFFIGKMSMTSHEMQTQVIQEMIRMDPGNCEWHGYFVQMLRFGRRLQENHRLYSEEEKEAIQTALKIPGAQFDLKIQISQIMYLAQRLRLRHNSNSNYGSGVNVDGLGFDNQMFHSAEEVVSFIKTEAQNILAMSPTSVRTNTDIAIIFSTTIPFEWRRQHTDFAKACMKRALLCKPNSSKANHRLAVLYTSEREFVKALKYMRMAYELNKRNWYALTGLLRIYMRDVKTHKIHLASTFDEALNYGFHQKCSKTVSYLLFLKAVWKFLDRKPGKAIELTLEAYTKHEETLSYFHRLESNVERYHWVKHFQGESILRGMYRLLFSEYSRCQYQLEKNPGSDLTARAKKLEILSDAAHNAMSTAGTVSKFKSINISDYNYNSSTGGQSSSENAFSYGSSSSMRTETRSRRGSETNECRSIFHESDPTRNWSSGIEDSWRNPKNNEDKVSKKYRDNRFSNSWDDDNWRRSASPILPEQSNNWRDSWGCISLSRNSLSSLAPSMSINANTRSHLADHYRILGVNPTASKADIGRAYYRLIIQKQLGNKNNLPTTEKLEKLEEMKKINLAWESLAFVD